MHRPRSFFAILACACALAVSTPSLANEVLVQDATDEPTVATLKIDHYRVWIDADRVIHVRLVAGESNDPYYGTIHFDDGEYLPAFGKLPDWAKLSPNRKTISFNVKLDAKTSRELHFRAQGASPKLSFALGFKKGDKYTYVPDTIFIGKQGIHPTGDGFVIRTNAAATK